MDRASLPPVQVEILTTGTVQLRDRHLRAGGDRREETGPILVLAVHHPTEGLILVDTGYGRRTATDPRAYPGSVQARTIGLTMRQPAADQLEARGISVASVRHLVPTHLHTDHAGGIADFPDATLWTTAREWSFAQRRRPIRGTDPEPYLDREPRWVDFDGTEPYGPFEGHVDLFGDGTVVLLPSPGHTPGSALILVNEPERSLLYVGDAAWADVNWIAPVPKGFLVRTLVEDNWREAMDTLWRVRAWHARHPDLHVVCGHDPSDLDATPAWRSGVRAW